MSASSSPKRCSRGAPFVRMSKHASPGAYIVTGRPRSRARTAATLATALIALLLALGAGGCGSTSPAPARAPLVIGFLYVGSVHDHGYNEAAYLGSLTVAHAFPQARIIQREHVPESPVAERVMEQMIGQ